MTRRGTIGQIDLDINFVTQHAWDSKTKQWCDGTDRVWSSEYYCRARGKNCWGGPESEVGSLRHHVASAKHQSRVLWYTDPGKDFDEDDEDLLQTEFDNPATSAIMPVAPRTRSRTPIGRRCSAPATVAKAKPVTPNQPSISELVTVAKKHKDASQGSRLTSSSPKSMTIPRETSNVHAPDQATASTHKVPIFFVPSSTTEVAQAAPPSVPGRSPAAETPQQPTVPSSTSALTMVPSNTTGTASTVPPATNVPPGWMLVPVPHAQNSLPPLVIHPQTPVIVIQPQVTPQMFNQFGQSPFHPQPFQFHSQPNFGQPFQYSGQIPQGYPFFGQPYWPF